MRVELDVRHSDAAEFYKTWTTILVDTHMPDAARPALENLLQPYHDGDRYARVYPQPIPGVWEIAVNNETPSLRFADTSRRTPLPPTHFILTATAYAVRTLSFSKIARGYTVSLLNTEAPFHPRASTTQVGDATESTITLTPGQPRGFVPIRVPKGATEVDLAATRLLGKMQGDANIYLFNCAKNVSASKAMWLYQGKCEYKAGGSLSSGGFVSTSLPAAGSGQMLMYEPTPPPGNWVAVIDASRTLAAPMRLRVAAIVKSPEAVVPTGGRWTATVVATRLAGFIGSAYIQPTIQLDESNTISETLPLTMNADVLLNTKPIVRHTYTTILLTGLPPAPK